MNTALKNKKYSTLLFDLDNTLLDFTQSESSSLRYIHKKYIEPHLSEQELIKSYRRINVALWDCVNNGTLTPSDVKEQRFTKLVNYHRLPICPQDLTNTYSEQLALSAPWYPGVQKTIDALRKHYRIGIITNGLAAVQKKKCQLAGISNWCDCILISEDIGIAKPDPRIFDVALKKLNTQASECLMIGDSLGSDYQGAKNSGIDFCWVSPSPEHYASHLPKPRYTISSVSDILD